MQWLTFQFETICAFSNLPAYQSKKKKICNKTHKVQPRTQIKQIRSRSPKALTDKVCTIPKILPKRVKSSETRSSKKDNHRNIPPENSFHKNKKALK